MNFRSSVSAAAAATVCPKVDVNVAVSLAGCREPVLCEGGWKVCEESCRCPKVGKRGTGS